MSEVKNIYNLKLHETIHTPFGMGIMRVPGGWIYDCWDYPNDRPKLGVFVPYNNELFNETLEIK